MFPMKMCEDVSCAASNNVWNDYKNSADQWHLYYNMQDNFQLVAIGEKNSLIFIEEDLFEKFSAIGDETKNKAKD